MGMPGAWGLIAVLVAVPALASAQAASPPMPAKPLPGARSRGVQVLMPGQAAASDGQVVAVATPAPQPPAPQPPAPSPLFIVAPVTHPVARPCGRPFTQADLTLGARGFDHSLAGALRSHAVVVVDVAEPYDPSGEPPASLSPWLSAARAGGGAVTVSPYCTAGRGIFSDWVDDVVAHVSGRIYRPARSYDVVLYADAARRRVTQVQFKPKPFPVAAN